MNTLCIQENLGMARLCKDVNHYVMLLKRFGEFKKVGTLVGYKTSKCPSKCSYCFLGSFKAKTTPLIQVDKIVDAVKKNECDAVFMFEKCELGVHKPARELYRVFRDALPNKVTIIITTKYPNEVVKYVKPKDNTLVLISMTNPKLIEGLEGKNVPSYVERCEGIVDLINKGYRVGVRFIVMEEDDLYHYKMLYDLEGLDTKQSIISILRLNESNIEEVGKYIDVSNYHKSRKNWSTIFIDESLVTKSKKVFGNSIIYDLRTKHLNMLLDVDEKNYISQLFTLNNEFKGMPCVFFSDRKCQAIATTNNSYYCKGWKEDKVNGYDFWCSNALEYQSKQNKKVILKK